MIVEALRREADHIEVRMVECVGHAGTAAVTLKLPQRSAAPTELAGRKRVSLPLSQHYTIPLRPQQIVTMHFEVDSTLPESGPIKPWDAFVSKDKLAALHAYDPS